MTAQGPPWICCQIGTREHYAVPRALHRCGLLDQFITDAWCPAGSVAATVGPSRLRQRFHPDLSGARVAVAGAGPALFEAWNVLAGPGSWRWRLWRNRQFQKRVVSVLAEAGPRPGGPRVLFAYSYAALAPFEFAKARGWTTVLGQIDPGYTEERIVARLHAERPDLAGSWRPAPTQYWQAWRAECALADHVVVNSAWSARALEDEGVGRDKIHIVPLAYQPPAGSESFQRTYPERFSPARPMRVLFLGQVNLRKGMAAVLDAFAGMRDPHITLDVVGLRQLTVPPDALADPRIRWHGAIPHADAAEYYRRADVFLFPTHSDGFGLTQLEAQAWRLPIIASTACGDVVRDGVDGVRLAEVSGPSLVEVLRALAASPARLAAMSRAIAPAAEHGLAALGARLQQLVVRA